MRQSVQTITDLIAVPALINLDFADVKSVMENQGQALIGIGMSNGENKAVEAADKAIRSPLLDGDITGAHFAIVNVTGGSGMTLYDSSTVINHIKEAAGTEIDIIYGAAVNDKLGDNLIVTIIATGFDDEAPIETVVEGGHEPFNPEANVTAATPEVEDNDIPVFFKKIDN